MKDRGQAFPIYVVAVAGLLFAALAVFVVGQAATTRSDAQGAADAAALAAARDARDHLVGDVSLPTLPAQGWEDLLKGVGLNTDGACEAASSFAAHNGATVSSCTPALLSFKVEVQTDRAVGASVIPGTETLHGTADARAVIEPRCRMGPPADPAGTPSENPAEAAGPIKIKCKGGKELTYDPAKPDPWKMLARKLFDVRLAE
ncbi:pilus assembly protein TadG-related protein [Streptomyces toxytricini]|uniref:pilus assembly protein TadG-related protein n=1 Tax=Streptomyces toxytricini TaxID=67369 RepID=UPI003418E138